MSAKQDEMCLLQEEERSANHFVLQGVCDTRYAGVCGWIRSLEGNVQRQIDSQEKKIDALEHRLVTQMDSTDKKIDKGFDEAKESLSKMDTEMTSGFQEIKGALLKVAFLFVAPLITIAVYFVFGGQ